MRPIFFWSRSVFTAVSGMSPSPLIRWRLLGVTMLHFQRRLLMAQATMSWLLVGTWALHTTGGILQLE